MENVIYSNVLIVIPARLDSSRLPEKLLAQIHGKPLIYWVATRVKHSELADYIVATDSEKIAEVCRQYEIPYLMTSSECINGTERVFEVAEKKQDQYEFFLNVQGDEPLINTDLISTLLNTIGINDDAFKTAVSLTISEENNSSEVKVAMQSDGRIRYASRSSVPFYRDGKGEVYKIHGVYLYTFDVLSQFVKAKPSYLENAEKVEQLRCIENDILIYGIKTPHTPNSVDTEKDLNYYRALPKDYFEKTHKVNG